MTKIFEKLLPGLLLTLAATTSFAAPKELSAQDIRERLQLHADVYAVDASGERIISGPELTGNWRPDRQKGVIKGDWSSGADGSGFALRYLWEVTDDGRVKVTLEEYGTRSNGREPQFSNLLERKEIVLKNFEPIIWKIKNIKDRNLIVRYMPSLRELSTPLAVDSLPLAGSGISISDSAGYLWAEDVQLNGKYSGITSHRGTIALSYVPFKGAKELGSAEGNLIVLNIDKSYKINLKSTTSFLPAGVTAKVYAVYIPEKKSGSFHSLSTFNSSKESRMADSLSKELSKSH